MPNWKKVILSGSNAHINNLTASGHLSALDDGFTVNENATTELFVDGNITASGDIIAEGNIIANQYIVSSSVTYMTQSFSDGSTIFGDSLSPLDTHQFTGSLFITGITYDDTPQPAAAVLIIDTASGQLYYTGSYGGGGGEDNDWYIDGINITSSRNVIVDGYVSASNTLYASDIRLGDQKFADPSPSTLTNFQIGNNGQGSLILTNITASGDISASGDLFAGLANDSAGNYNNTVVFDTVTGKFYYTGSYGGGGGALDLQDVTDNGEITTNGGRFFNGQSYTWGGWSSQNALSGFQINGSAALTRVTPQRVAQGVRWHLVGNMADPLYPGRLEARNWLVFDQQLYALSSEIYNSNGAIGSNGGIGGLVLEGGGLQLRVDSSSNEPATLSLIPGNEGPGIYFFERASLTAEGSGSANHNSASAKLIFDTSSQSIQFFAGSTDEELKKVMFISKSGDNPRIGVGTDDPKAIFDFKDVEDTTVGAELLLRSARTTEGAITGDEGGSINFAIDSSSFANPKTNGSIAKIKSVVTNISSTGAQGKLVFEGSKDTTSAAIDIMAMGYQEGGLSGFGTVFTSSMLLKGFSTLLPPEFILKDSDDNVQFSVDDGNVEISGSLGVTGSATFDGGATSTTLTLTNTSVQNSEATSLMINGSGVVGTRELGTAAFREADQDLRTTDDVTFNTVTTTGNLTVQGDIVAENYIVSSSVTYMTQSFSSGSTVFGDTLDDTHQFTGSLDVTGSLTVDGITFPIADGDNGDTLITDGAGNLSFARTTVYANVKNVHGSELVKGMPVHVTGAVGNTSEVIAASASNAATMPAHFILNETLADDAEGLAIAVGYINQVNTGDFSEGDTVYVGADGGYTNVKPTGSNLIQNLGIVDKVDASNGSGFILGAGRSNDVPNISPGYVWVGNNSSVATAVATSSLSVATASFVGSIHGGTF